MTMRYLSVCSGIEAATVAWHPLGWSPVAFAEIEPFPCAVLAHHYGSNLPGEPLATNGVPNLGDITRFATWPDLAIDLLVGGTPCQSFSVAGLRKGLADPRGNLALTYLGIADRYRPRWVVWENVPGVLSSGGGRDFGAFLGGLGELGYGFAYRVLDAQFVRVDGFGRAVPQRRRRVFVVGHLGDWRRAPAVLFDAASLHGDPSPRRGQGEKLADSPAYGIDRDCLDRDGEASSGTAADRSGLGIEAGIAQTIRAKGPGAVAYGGNRQSGPLDVATAVNAHGGPHGRQDFESETFVLAPVAGTLGSNRKAAGSATTQDALSGLLLPIPFDTTQITSPDNRAQPMPGAPCHPLSAGAHPPAIAFSCKDHGADAGEIAPTLRSMGHAGSHANAGGQLAVAFRSISAAVRRLTPLECERLQAFPDGYTAIPFRGKLAADGPRYKALGNSKAVNCPRWIGRRIEAVEAIGAEMREAAE